MVWHTDAAMRAVEKKLPKYRDVEFFLTTVGEGSGGEFSAGAGDEGVEGVDGSQHLTPGASWHAQDPLHLRPGGLLHGAHEGNHHLDIRQTHVVADAPQSAALEFETGPERVGHVTGGPPESEHRVFLVGLVLSAADQVCVLVGFEVRHAHNHRFGPESTGDCGNAFS